MTSIALQSLSICIVYGIMSIFQTLNSRYLFRNLNFDFYSFVIFFIYLLRHLVYKKLSLFLSSIGKVKKVLVKLPS
jgi:hypothetical protein